MFYLTTNKKVCLNNSAWDSSRSNVTRGAGAFQKNNRFAKETRHLKWGLYTAPRQKVVGLSHHSAPRQGLQHSYLDLHFSFAYLQAHPLQGTSHPSLSPVRKAVANPPAENTAIPFRNKETTLPLLLSLVPASTCRAWLSWLCSWATK